MKWFVLYTKPRWEMKVAQELEKQNIEVYCPQITEVRQWSDRKKKVTTPLFKSYVFVHLDEKNRSVVFDTPGIVQYLFWQGKPAVVRDIEIETIKNWLEDDRVEDIEISHLSPGDRLTIASGSFQGREAAIQKVGSKRLKLTLIGMGIVVNLKVSEVLT